MPPSQQHHILLFGGTGICGQIFTRAALLAGHKLTLYVRTPSKLHPDISSDKNVETIKGQLDDEEGLRKAANCGADIFISLAGPTLGWREGTPITAALRKFYPLLLKANPKIRIMILSTASYSAPQDTRSIKWFFGIQGFIRTVGGSSYDEISGMAETTVSLGDQVEWTLFRVPLLKGSELSEEQKQVIRKIKDGNAGLVDMKTGNPGQGKSLSEQMAKVNAAFVGDSGGKDWLLLDRGRLVIWMLGEIEERRWIRQAPTLANTSWL